MGHKGAPEALSHAAKAAFCGVMWKLSGLQRVALLPPYMVYCTPATPTFAPPSPFTPASLPLATVYPHPGLYRRKTLGMKRR